MKNLLKKIPFKLYTFFIILCLLSITFKVRPISALENDSSDLIRKVSKDYTNKFCNSIAFGLSKESAMKFAIEENHKIFKKRKGFKNINKELLSEEVAVSVIENCGYPIKLNGNKGIEEFKEYYQLTEKNIEE